MNEEKKKAGFRDFPGYDRRNYPDNIVRITAGAGGEALLILGSDKTALMDCGMAYCADLLIENLKEILAMENRKLDMIFLSHTHYDHIGALPYVLEVWKEVVVYGAEYCTRVFASTGAKNKMKELGNVAWLKYKDDEPLEIMVDGLRIDKILKESDKISLGKEYIEVLETKGHTDCSLTYILQPAGIMFSSESTGVLESPEFMHVPILKSYSDSMESLEKCKNFKINHLICPHYGMIPDFFIGNFWEIFTESAEEKKDYLYGFYQEKLTFDEILENYTAKYWNDARGAEQPKEAFRENAKNIIIAIMKEF